MTIAEILEIMDIALQVNGLDERSKEKTGSLPTVLVDFSGHVARLRVDIHESGWPTYDAWHDRQFIFCTDEPLDEQSFGDYKDYMARLLERCLQQGGSA